MTKILVIGGGPGGYVAAIRAAQLGADVTLVEKDRLGGTCLNVGCIPTKALLHSAELFEEARKAGLINADVKADFGKVQARKETIVKQLVGGVRGLLSANKIRVINGAAVFTGKNTAAVNGETIPFEKAIIATGSLPASVPIPGVNLPPCIDSTGALSLQSVPQSMVVIGGGVIGVEMATVYAALGCKITIVEMLEEILPPLDREMTGLVRAQLVKKGIVIKTGAKVLSVAEDKTGAAVTIEQDGKQEAVSGEKVLVCVGRKSNTADLALDAAGIAADRGRVTVNNKQETNVPGVYAVGDCTGGSMLAHVAMTQGEIAAENAMGHSAVYDGRTNPSCVYTSPEAAGVGLTEEQAKKQNLDYKTGKFPLAANGKNLVMGGEGMVKIIAGKRYGEVLGLHIVGPRATDLIGVGALAIRLEATLDELISTIYAHPTIGESLREAALAAEGRAVHIPPGR
ncbi:MAG: dihydrolipoyl dehydrogenase [Spirochaetales bacterium]|jgi:dihydrolipoamide dehydrogenase|nr:dihydrolipoyl dehydrogenase [Spirochaetales bacterium]